MQTPRRPYVLLSAAVSVDGYLDDASPRRLVLSSEADLDRVDAVRAAVDAILVGANTVRRDNPRLEVRSPARRQARLARGEPEGPVKVTVSASGGLDPATRFFTSGDVAKLVYVASGAVGEARCRVGGVAEVVDAGEAPVAMAAVLADLARRGVGRLLVEGGGTVHTQLLAAGLADELHLVVAPLFVGDPAAPRFVRPGDFPHHGGNRMRLAETRQLGDVVFLRYLLGPVSGGGPGDDRTERRRTG